MKHYILHLLSAWLLLSTALLSSCEYRDIVTADRYTDLIEEDNSCLYILDIDWSEMDELPTGMTVLFYPSDGRFPYIRLSNEVEHYEVVLPQDEYRVLVFNQSVNEFSYLVFSGMDAWNTIEVQAKEFDSEGKSRIDRLYLLPSQAHASQRQSWSRDDDTRAKSVLTNLKVKGIGSATGSVSATQQNTATPSTRAKSVVSNLKVKPSINRMTINVRVQGLSTDIAAEQITPTVSAVNGALTGLASGLMLGTGTYTDGSLTQELDEWTIHSVDTPTDIGSVQCSFGVFGISPEVSGNTQSRSVTLMNSETYVEATEEDDTENILYLNFRLTDGTYVPFRFNVTDRIREQMYEDYLELTLDIGISLDNTELDDPLHLPETGLPYGGLGITVKEWDDEEQQEIIMQ